jgi:hypothetical protein
MSPKNLFSKRKLMEFDESEEELRNPAKEFRSKPEVPKDMEYTIVSEGRRKVSAPQKLVQEFRILGYDDKQVAKTLEAVKILDQSANRQINPLVFAKIKKRYSVGVSAMVALSSLCKQEAADLGLILKSLVRFYKRGGFSTVDLDEIERFVSWVVSRGDTILGVPSAWAEYCSLHKITRKDKLAKRSKSRKGRSKGRKSRKKK